MPLHVRHVQREPPFGKGGKGGFSVLNYRHDLKQKARQLRTNMKDAELRLWHALQRRQIQGVQFFRQRPIGEYIVDFYAPVLKLVLELDGCQHLEPDAIEYDANRTHYFETLGLTVMRFDNLQMLNETSAVLNALHHFIDTRNSALRPSTQLMECQ
ncbi:MAG: endonuclease domain-containing protein [Usitatibacteraceae bacterium]